MFLDQVKILEERAIAGHSLGADAGTANGEVLGADGGDEFLEGFGEEGFAERSAPFFPRHQGVAAEEIPEAGEAEDFGGLERMDVGFAVAFAGERKNGIWAGFDSAVDEAGEVDAEEGEGGVGHGVDEVTDEVARFGGEFEILSTERDDADIVFGSSEGGDAVTEKTGAVDEVGAFKFPCGGFKDPTAEVVMDSENACAGLKSSAEALDFANEGVTDRLVIDDAFLWNAQCCEAGGMGFDFAELLSAKPLEAFEAVLGSTRFEFAKATDFGFVCGDDDFSADFVGDPVFAAEIRHQTDSAHGKAGLQRAGLVIEAAVEDTAVVRALVAAGAVFFFKDADRRSGFAEKQLAGDGEAYDAAPDDKMVMLFQILETRSHSGSTRSS